MKRVKINLKGMSRKFIFRYATTKINKKYYGKLIIQL